MSTIERRLSRLYRALARAAIAGDHDRLTAVEKALHRIQHKARHTR